jgi:hypothetical protein
MLPDRSRHLPLDRSSTELAPTLRASTSAIAVLSCALVLSSCGTSNSAPGPDAGSTDAAAQGDAGTGDAGRSDSGTDGSTSCATPPTPPADAAPLLQAACDSLVPTHCGYPFPSNVYLIDDTTTTTGKRVAIPSEAMPQASTVGRLDPAMVADSDGFSPGQTILTHLPGATITGLPTQDTLAASVLPTSPTILLNASTGELVPHFAELDMELPSEAASDRAFMIRPVVRLADATRYIVAIRHVKDGGGNDLPPTPVFQALRDGTASCDPSVALRRTLYADIFAKLKVAGVDPSDLQLAWDYSTASEANNTRWLLAMRDAALAAVGTSGPAYTLFPPAAAGTMPPPSSPSCNNLTAGTNPAETHAGSPSEIGSGNCSQDSPNAHIWRRLFGLMTVPLYTTSPNPTASADSGAATPAGLSFGSNGMPAQNGTTQVEFEVNIPVAATKTPGAPLANGHGLFGDKTEGQDDYLAALDDAGDFVSVAVDLLGLCKDDSALVASIASGDPTQFKSVVGRQHQGLLDSLLAMRLMTALAQDPATFYNGQPTIDPTKRFYRGDSQGGIMGTTYMAITTDVGLGVLGESGAPYSLLLNRSTDFAPFFTRLQGLFGDGRDLQMLFGLVQMVWDRTEPDGYMPYIVTNNLPGTPAHSVLIRDNIGDYQVTPLGAHVIARAVGAKNLSQTNRELYGIPDAPGPFAGPGIVEWSWGLTPAPETNVPPGNLCPANAPAGCGDPHDQLRLQPAAIEQEIQFFKTGMVVQTCSGGGDGGAAGGPCVGSFM